MKFYKNIIALYGQELLNRGPCAKDLDELSALYAESGFEFCFEPVDCMKLH